MAALKIGIIEDELIVARSISVLLKNMGYNPIKPVRNYDDALNMIRTESPDLLLVDIILDGEKDGIELAKTVNKEFGIPFIFLTANSDPSTIDRAKEVRPYAYLVKPFYEKDLHTSIEIAFNNFQEFSKNSQAKAEPQKQSEFIFVKEGDTFHRLPLSDILYIESDHVYLHIYTEDRNFLIRSKLENFMQLYSNIGLIRVHRSYAINPKFLASIGQTTLQVGSKVVPLNRNYRQPLMSKLDLLR